MRSKAGTRRPTANSRRARSESPWPSLRAYQRASQATQQLFARLYLEGLATGDFGPVFRELVGETTALSANTVVRLKEHWGQEYQEWRQRPLGEHRYAYIWADGIYLAAGTEPEKAALLCILGAREDGQKELLAMESGYRESTESWAEVLRGLRDRGDGQLRLHTSVKSRNDPVCSAGDELSRGHDSSE